ncbi:HigA family addiction module antidote protein [Rhodoblastus acidophilus]|uniref:HigA family addiction module antidote protein n=1 Tax=Candidatus Rhodoblastus alkanivorans TaxID=2954117 RepID=A0ABS9Z314_9HYPH|nr:HigA family addiction module antitoxin [Candidatus Rhodoblastus alkanivorans]MCI4679035.1 HigA family addiction module antidote protein [Candidatus Rhodoblastus alkanivorans]MCI4681710.1 HigA family addiction module antidote protein [Candidatus Rhodoblastus alkanivorans]MDI4642758.1 HigA family addiction module antidote protein [Rhodoblastus acidophilus]
MIKLPPVHPGEVLREEFLRPLDLSAGAVARAIGVPRTRIERLASEQVDLTPDTALRLARFFETSPEFWMGIQSRYALESASDAISDDLDKIEPVKKAG